MTKIILSAILLLILPIQVWGTESIVGSFNCKIKYQKILEMKEGIAKEYDRYENDIKVGNSFFIEYHFDMTHNSIIIFSSNKPTINGIGLLAQGFYKKNIYSDNFNFYIGGDDLERNANVTLDKNGDFFKIQPINYGDWVGRTNELYLQRYYKNDWTGIFSKIVSSNKYELQYQIVGLDCRNTDDKFYEIIADLKSKDLMD